MENENKKTINDMAFCKVQKASDEDNYLLK